MIYKQNGEVICQKEEMLEYLNGEIVGKSHLQDGRIFLVTRSLKEAELNILTFNDEGKAEVVAIWEALEDRVSLHLDDPALNDTLLFSNDVLVSDNGDLVLIGRVKKPIQENEEEDELKAVLHRTPEEERQA